MLLEAMAAEKPIIGTNTGAIPDIISNCGIIVDKENPKAISNGLEKLFNNPELVSKMIQKGNSDIEKKFTLERMFKQTHEVYQKALND